MPRPEREWFSCTNSTSIPSSRQTVVAEGLDQEAALVAVRVGSISTRPSSCGLEPAGISRGLVP